MGFVKKETVERKRIIPIDANNEQYILGHAMNDKETAVSLEEFDSEQFLFVNHKVLCKCIQYAMKEGLTLGIDTLDSIKMRYPSGAKLTLEYMGQLEDVFSTKVPAEDYTYHLTKLKTDKIKDTLASFMMPDLHKAVIDPRVPVEELLSKVDKLRSFIEDQNIKTDFQFIDMEQVDDDHTAIMKAREEGTTFQGTGYKQLDRVMTDGYAPKKITVVAGRPGMGKSAYTLNSLLRLACLGIPVAIYNLEMDHISNYDRAISILSQVPISKMVKGRDKMTDLDRLKEKKAKEFLRHIPMYFYKASTQTLPGIRREVRILREKYGVQVVAYDLFKKIRFCGRKNSSTADIINDALDQMQAMGKDLDVHQIIVVQIGRSAEKRKNKRPRLSELKDAGGYEEVADNVLFMYRPKYYQDAEETDGEPNYLDVEDLEIHIAKQRQGSGNIKVMLDFRPALTAIDEAE